MRSNNELTLAYNILNTISNKSQYNEVIIRDQYDIYHFTLAVNEFVHNMEWSGSEDGDGGGKTWKGVALQPPSPREAPSVILLKVFHTNAAFFRPESVLLYDDNNTQLLTHHVRSVK